MFTFVGFSEKREKSKIRKRQSLIAGLLAGVATVITDHLFDTVKVKGLYRGATSSFSGMGFESSLLFGIYSQTKQSLQCSPLSVVSSCSIVVKLSFFSVGCKFKEMTPWFQKFNRYSSPLDCALQTVKNEG
ncbi:hypothetical protein DKX38_005579 [Salix brachista]|uniref:Uncharacterized protein n=1 Tax=Salix brachista TaxID=2182728 RepID=A0A5N5N0E9_9ROSI|nr:hypothetical protein DKX38_005579 [Salix brachista]